VSFSYVEILKEDVLDLMAIHDGVSLDYSGHHKSLPYVYLPSQSPKLDIRTNARGEVLVPNLNVTDLSSFEEFEASYAWVSA